MSFGLFVLKIFSKDFAPVGTIFTVYSLLVICIALIRRARLSNAFIRKRYNNNDGDYFVTSGSTVIALGVLNIVSYIALLLTILRL